jgi:thymidylate synthase
MIPVFEAKTASEVWRLAANELRSDAARSQASRGGPTRELLHSIFSIEDPRQRWVLSRGSAINPAFAIAEVVWIMRGRNDSALVNAWNSQLPKFAGEGTTYHGAYGHRLRVHLGFDQLERAYLALTNVPDSRQIALQIWDARIDLPAEDGSPKSRDIPCNIMSLLKVRAHKLEWMQIMRSNDLYRGTPYNFVQFTTLQEVISGWLGLQMGAYNHLSDSLHIYERDLSSIEVSGITPISSSMPGDFASNTDSLMLDKAASDRTFLVMESLIERLAAGDLSQDRLRSLSASTKEELPTAYRNLYLVVAAEAARRRGWSEMSSEIMSENTNPALRQAWLSWAERMRPSARSADHHQKN